MLLYETGRKFLLQAGYHDIGMDHFSLATDSLYTASSTGTLHRNFMGYTHQHTQLSIGLGVSSISDSWYAFAQNVKSVDAYLQMISADEFPVIKGHILTEKDLTARKNILDIMCKLKTTISSNAVDQHDFIARLATLEQDGLIRFNKNKLIVSNTGKSFLRNICMCFDERLWDNKPESQIFSSAV